MNARATLGKTVYRIEPMEGPGDFLVLQRHGADGTVTRVPFPKALLVEACKQLTVKDLCFPTK